MDFILSSFKLFAKILSPESGRYIFHTISPAPQYSITIREDSTIVVERNHNGIWNELSHELLEKTLVPLVVTKNERYGFQLRCTYEQWVLISCF